MPKKTRLVILSVVLVALFMSASAFRSSDIYFEIQRGFSIWSDVFSEVSLRYVDDVEPSFLTKVGIEAMLNSLDPYTVLIDETASRDLDIITKGTYAGVGMEVRQKEGNLVVYHVMEGYSAFKAGIRPGDIILQIDGYSLQELSLEDANSLMLGDTGTQVELLIKHGEDGEEELYELIRERISVGNIGFSGWLEESAGVAYINLARFAPQAARDVRAEMERFAAGDSLKALVLDLRNNPGGLLNEAVNLVDLFVPEGIQVVSTDGRLVEMNDQYFTKEKVFFDGPLIVLQNESSASASEVVAGALQDLDRAVIYGRPSYGKGLVQIISPLSYDHSLKITVSRYLLPSGRSIQSILYGRGEDGFTQTADSIRQVFKTSNGRVVRDGRGIDPDVVVADEVYSPYITALLRKDIVFDFANELADDWSEGHEIDREELVGLFLQELSEKDFSFETTSERISSQLIAGLDDEITDLAKIQSLLNEAIEQEKQLMMDADLEEVSRLLELEMVERTQGMQARTARSLQLDPWVIHSIELLKNANAYQDLLKAPDVDN